MNPKTFNKVFIGLTFFLLLFFVFNLGIDAAKADGKEAILDGVQAAFWLFAFVLFSKLNRESEKMDREIEESKAKLDKSLDDLLGSILEKHSTFPHIHGEDETTTALERKLNRTLISIIKDVTKGEDEPNDEQIAEISKRFKAETKHDVIIARDGIGLNVKISRKQVAEKPATKKAPVKKPVAKKAPTTKKPVTKKGK